MTEPATPRLDPDKLKNERRDIDLGSEAENEGHDHVTREPGRAPQGDESLRQPISGAIPPAR